MTFKSPYLRIASSAARLAGSMMIRSMQRMETVDIQEKSINDFVTSVDLEAEQIIIQEIQKYYPEHRIVTEESGLEGNDNSNVTWLIDPLDGTTNFIRGIPHFAISIACLVNGRIEQGLIYDPLNAEEFSASRGHGAQLNQHKIRCSKQAHLKGSLIATGIPFSGTRLESLPKFQSALTTILESQTSGIRRLGSAALDLAYVAAGRYDAYWEHGLSSWDMAAGILIAKESGAMVADFDGGESMLTSGNIVAASPKVFREFLPIINKNYRN